MSPRVLFMGSPAFSLPALETLAKEYEVCGVVTQPDRPAGRGRGQTPPPVKTRAIELGIPVVQPDKLKDPAVFQCLVEWKPDLIVVAAYGQILRQNVLNLPPMGCLNVHASLLPRWRGASPIQFAILAGDEETGISIMKMDAGLDTGPVLSQQAESIRPEDTSQSLGFRLARLGASLLAETLPRYLAGKIQPTDQDSGQATYARLLKKEDGLLDLDQAAAGLERKIRAFHPWPGTFILWQGQPLKILSAHVVLEAGIPAGQRTVHARQPALGTGQGILVLDEVQPAGKRPMPGSVFLGGARSWVN